MADADGRQLEVSMDARGNVWLRIGDQAARLEASQAVRLGGRLLGTGQRAVMPPAVPPADDRAPTGRRAYKVIAERLERRIMAGEFGTRGRLPAASGLAAWYGVSVATIDRARRELRERGLVTVEPGMGTYAAWPGNAKRPASPGGC
jgi:hypothetical protein